MGISSDPPPDDPKHNVVMGYPPASSPHPPPSHPQAYPPSSYNQQYPHVYAPSPYNYPHGYPSTSSFQHHPACHDPHSQPYNEYYYQQQYNKPMVQESGNSASFGRVMLMLMIVLVASMCMMCLVMWFLFGAYIPEFEVTSIKVSNFTATNTTLTGLWNVALSISNVNKELSINFDHGMSSIFYKDTMLGISTLQSFDVEKKQRFGLNFTMPVEQKADDHKLQSWVLPALAEDRGDGVVVCSLRVAVEANFTAPNIVYREESLRILCEDVQINFSPATGEGTLSPGLGNTCLVRLHEGLN